MRNIVVVSWIATAICTIGWIARISQLAEVKIGNSRPILSLPYMLGMTLAFYVVPIILWIIAAITSKPTVQKNERVVKMLNILQYNNSPEISKLCNEIIDLELKRSDLNKKYELIKRSLSQGLWNQERFDEEKLKIQEESVSAKQKITQNERRLNAILAIRGKLFTLEKMLENGLVTKEEIEKQKEELINSYMNTKSNR